MTSSTQMKDYFHQMAAGKIKPSDISYIKQKGRGLNNYRSKKLKYRVNQVGRSSSLLSPVEQNILQAARKSAIKSKTKGKRRHLGKGQHRGKKTSHRGRKKSSNKKKPKAVKTKKKKKSRDIFSK